MARADFAGAKAKYRSTDLDDVAWKQFFDTPEGFGAMGKLIGDIYDEVLAEEEKERGVRSLGRRPAREPASLEVVFRKVFGPEHSSEPFPEALRKLIEGKSQRQFAMKIPCDQSTLSRLMTGAQVPGLDMMERIALAATVNPGYFMEWRAIYLSELVKRALIQKPNLSLTMLRHLKKSRGAYDTSVLQAAA